MKTILAMVYPGDDWDQEIPISDPKYRTAYELFYDLARAQGLSIIRSSVQWYDGKRFTKGWSYDKGQWKRVRSYTPHIIENKCSFGYAVPSRLILNQLEERFIVVNQFRTEVLMNDKYLTTLLFQKFFPKTIFIRSTAEMITAIRQIPGSRVVVKPVVGTGGKDVRILSKRSARKKEIQCPSLVQTFKDTSRGVPGVSRGIHDLRIHFLNAKPFYAYIRQPKLGKLVANIAQGGTMTMVPLRQLPRTLDPIFLQVQNIFRGFHPTFFSVDVMFDRQEKPFIVEMNSKPGIYFPPEARSEQIRIFRRLADFYLQEARR
jgi:hypothetical protein